MDSNERAETIIKIVAPLGVLVAPIFLILLWRAPNPDGPEHAELWLVLFLNFIGVGGWFTCLYLCRRYWGWFQKRQ